MTNLVTIKTPAEIDKMRRAGQVVALTLKELEKAVRPGITTAELDRLAEETIRDQGGVPSFKGYQGYPASICASVNEEVVHGIPGSRVLQEGDIVGVDLGAIVEGYHGDAALTFAVGTVSEEAAQLMRVTREALDKGIEKVRAGAHLSDIGHAVQHHAEKFGYSVVRDLVGHGIGTEMHEAPQVPNYGKPGRGLILKPGMTLAIEPMVNAGGQEVKILGDGWTFVTRDRSLSAHFEHTVAVTQGAPEILTAISANTRR